MLMKSLELKYSIAPKDNDHYKKVKKELEDIMVSLQLDRKEVDELSRKLKLCQDSVQNTKEIDMFQRNVKEEVNKRILNSRKNLGNIDIYFMTNGLEKGLVKFIKMDNGDYKVESHIYESKIKFWNFKRRKLIDNYIPESIELNYKFEE